MMPSLPEYEEFIYSLQEHFQSIITSTLVVKRRSINSAQIKGTLFFENDIILRILETIDFITQEIVDYSYEVHQGSEKLYWYDCWPHPDDPTLASTHPHHKHIPPDIKHNRIPTEIISFDRPNLPALITEIESLL